MARAAGALTTQNAESSTMSYSYAAQEAHHRAIHRQVLDALRAVHHATLRVLVHETSYNVWMAAARAREPRLLYQLHGRPLDIQMTNNLAVIEQDKRRCAKR